MTFLLDLNLLLALEQHGRLELLRDWAPIGDTERRAETFVVPG